MTSDLPGVPGVQPERLAEGKEPKHCALSLVGEPIMYPEINTLVRLLHEREISTFLVTNAQFPDAIRCYVLYNPHTLVKVESNCIPSYHMIDISHVVIKYYHDIIGHVISWRQEREKEC